jgi:tRNA-dihydrouridine synthase A
MITTGALIHGQRDRLLRFDQGEHPVALQIGGSEPDDLARAAAWGEQAGYDEINLNCGCPSERVQRGAFGACLMAEPDLVADCVRAMREVVKVPVTVKHRIGLDRDESYDFVARFVDRVAQAGCRVFIVHARNAWLQGLSPKENREVPPLRYETVYRLKRDFPSLTIVINGGLRSHEEALRQLDHVDGVMLGRAACDDPWLLARVDSRFYGAADPIDDRLQVLEAIRPFLAQQVVEGVSARAVLRHVMGLFNGLPGARAWRRTLSDSAVLAQYGAGTLDQALARMLRT